MPKILLSLDGVVTRQAQLTKERTALGRRPYNDIVLDHLAVSGEHAVLVLSGGSVSIEDLDSTNGTFVNGKAVKKQAIKPGDLIEIGRYQLALEGDGAQAGGASAPGGGGASEHERSAPSSAAAANANASDANASASPTLPPINASVRVLSGPASGRVLGLDKAVTTVGLPDVSIASITRRGQGFALAHVGGPKAPTLNGTPLGSQPLTLHNGDVISVAGNNLRFSIEG